MGKRIDAFLERLAQANQTEFGPGGPECCNPGTKGTHRVRHETTSGDGRPAEDDPMTSHDSRGAQIDPTK